MTLTLWNAWRLFVDVYKRQLLDRMEIIELGSYTREEKFQIAKKHLVRKQLAKHGISPKQLSIADAAIYDIIDSYTREAGVRNLERYIGTICRKVAAVSYTHLYTCMSSIPNMLLTSIKATLQNFTMKPSKNLVYLRYIGLAS